MRAVLSTATNPFANLAFETVLFRHRRPGEALLFLYFNEPCVVIGRNQNPWAECNLASGVPLLRRKSGGGAVVHDLGNANFCVQTDKAQFSRTKHLDMIVRAFPSLDLEVNARHDLVRADGRKVSGSSYKLERAGAYHHATLLLNSDLARLSSALKVPPAQGKVLSSGGTESVRSPVANTGLARQDFVAGCVAEFRRTYGGAGHEVAGPADFGAPFTAEVRQEMQDIMAWEWVFGKTPRFRIRTPAGDELDVEKGLVGGKRLPLQW